MERPARMRGGLALLTLVASLAAGAACQPPLDDGQLGLRADLSPARVPERDLDVPPDLVVPIEEDLATPTPDDLAIRPDLTARPDLVPPPDLVTVDPWGPQFHHPLTVPLGANAGASFVRGADLDGDKRADVALVDATNGKVLVLFGKGDGTFEAPVEAVLMAGKSLTIGDFDGDGRRDVAALGTDEVLILLNDGKRGFGAHRTVRMGQRPRGIAAADVDGDGKLDVAVSDNGADRVTVLLGDGQGGLANPLVVPASSGPTGVSAADLDGDHKPELLVHVSGPNHGVILVFGNTGRPGTPSFAAATELQVGHAPTWGPAVHDLNNDKILDLVSPSVLDHDVAILLGAGNGMFAPALFLVGIGKGPLDVDVADFDGDGQVDLVVAESQTDDAAVHYLGNALRGRAFPVGKGPASLCAVDLDGNGKPDVVTANGGSHDLTVLLNAM